MPLLEKRSEHIDSDALSNLRYYKYQSVDKSFISRYILNHYWNFTAELMPLWLAPNVITLIGLCFIYFNILTVVVVVPDLVGPAPSWVYASFATGLWLYSTMDNIDGKQARRTGSSSPLGELFDHGIDSLNCTLGGLIETACMGLGPTGAGAFTTLIPCLAMFFSTWETYHTHTLYLGYINGPTEGIIVAVAVMIVSAVWGPQFWQNTIGDLVPWRVIPGFVASVPMRDLWVTVVAAAFIFAHLPFCVLNVYRARQKARLPFLPALIECVPISLASLATYLWLSSPYSVLLRDNHLVLYALATSFAFGRVTTKIILAHLTRQAFPYWTILMVPTILAPILFRWLPAWFGTYIGGPWFEVVFLYAYLAFAASYFLLWSKVVINAICDYLGINCFTIKHSDKAQ
ncbi:hypothetical protein V1514DRAFT_194149 [Lipomyces japonicus]|uniref:uncharacterized protein n=1 Tax=Lipomyces japonicus TaxID=56871 RepID=UPI0034CF04AF